MDADGDGVDFWFNMRFPGQFYDTESGMHYNYFRDYEPGTGRYVESDPIGLEGGWNTYSYTDSNPIKFIDYFGEIKKRICIKKQWPKLTNPHTGNSLGGGYTCEWLEYEYDEFTWCQYSKTWKRNSECKKERPDYINDWSDKMCTKCKWKCGFDLAIDTLNPLKYGVLMSSGSFPLLDYGSCIWSCEVNSDQNFGAE